MIANVSLRSRTLVIESRDCIASPQRYDIVVTFIDSPSTEPANIPFSPHIEIDAESNVISPISSFTITVQVVETVSGTIIDEVATTLMDTTTTTEAGLPSYSCSNGM